MKRTRRLAIVYAVLGILTLLFFIGGPDYHSSRSFKAFWNLGHIFYYALLCVAIFVFARKRQRSVKFQITVILVVTLLLGVAVELLQAAGFNRTPDIGDLFRNFIGATVGIAFFLPGRKAFPRGVLRLIQAVSFVLVASQIYPVAAALTDEYRIGRVGNFPFWVVLRAHTSCRDGLVLQIGRSIVGSCLPAKIPCGFRWAPPSTPALT